MQKKGGFDLVIEQQDTEIGNLYLSGIQHVRRPQNLQAVNIKAVVSVLEERVIKQTKITQLLEHAKIAHMCIVLEDEENAGISEYFQKSAEFIRENLQKGNVLVHCVQGISRSASIVTYYLMSTFQWDFEKAIAFLRSKRKFVRPNDGFQKQLREASTKLNQSKKIQEK